MIYFLQHVEHETPDILAYLAKEYDLEFSICRIYLGDEIPQLALIGGLIVLGGSMGIDDESMSAFTWINKEIELISKCLDKGIPVIGICLGAQLISHCLGGKVEKLIDKESKTIKAELGWSKLYFNSNFYRELALNNFPPSLDVLHWHSDRIILPPEAILLASSERCREQFFRIGDNAFGLQFHIEVEYSSYIKWIEKDNDFIYQALGSEGKSILKEQFKIYSESSRLERTSLLRKIFSLLWRS